MRKLHADPTFAKAHAARAAERMRKLHADPTFAKANAERMRKLHADPTFAKANAERVRKRHSERLAALGVPSGAEDAYRVARRNHFSIQDAIEFAIRDAIKRGLLPPVADNPAGVLLASEDLGHASGHGPSFSLTGA